MQDRKRKETSRNQPRLSFYSFMYWIDVNWNQLGPYGMSVCLIHTARLSVWAIYQLQLKAGRRAFGGFSILRWSAKCTRRPKLEAVWNECIANIKGKNQYKMKRQFMLNRFAHTGGTNMGLRTSQNIRPPRVKYRTPLLTQPNGHANKTHYYVTLRLSVRFFKLY